MANENLCVCEHRQPVIDRKMDRLTDRLTDTRARKFKRIYLTCILEEK